MKNLIRGQIICEGCNKPFYAYSGITCSDCDKFNYIIRIRSAISNYNLFGTPVSQPDINKLAGIIVDCPDGYVRHHWSYNPNYATDVILLGNRDHFKLHNLHIRRYGDIYVTMDGVLLNSRTKHANFIDSVGFDYILPKNK